jgi:hypothetical protein
VVQCLVFIFPLKLFFLSIFMGSHVYEDNSKMDFDGKGNGSKEQIKLTKNRSKLDFCFNGEESSIKVGNVYQLHVYQCFTTPSVSCSCNVQHRYCETYLLTVSL